jgi:phosphoglycolate phosphatase-like HAD superfamily hydrolase
LHTFTYVEGMLILFDIDMTLITTGGAGMTALAAAGRGLFGERFSGEGVSFAGRLDPLIIHDMLVGAGVEPSAANHRAVRAAYAAMLPEVLGRFECRALPGVMALLEGLEGRRGVELGLLTGNFAETGQAKLRACGIDPGRFAIHVWGDESPHSPPRRDHLVPVGMERYRNRTGETPNGERVLVIGDTPHDVACARAHGCRSLGVATGYTSVEDLAAAGADRVVADLSDTQGMLRWILRPLATR